jgi:Cu/Ag efflux protein CusF
MSRRFFFAALCALLAACKKKAARAEKTYPLRGEVVSTNAQSKTATIKHEKIGDWMDAMTMEFPVRDDAGFAKLAAGRKLTATVHTIPETFEYWITDIHVEGQ